ncbi:Guanine nucleotide exchange factor lte1 [Diatrype stigma]|uniref:Guanine nucleotide exchange factor lte1 n=1 Tax=Diatrype stigma TaxID=117547 RepID=A0AAN9U6P1_9PEZI
MEADLLASQPPGPSRSIPSPRQPARRETPSKTQRSPYIGGRESKSRRSPPRLTRRHTDKADPAGGSGTSSGCASPVSTPVSSSKHLVPAVERRPSEATANARKDAEYEKGNIVPDGGSAGREGRQFTVAKVGNNGRIFLRPSVRPPNQRYPQPNFVFPATPPGTAGLETFTNGRQNGDGASELTSTRLTPLTDMSSPGLAMTNAYFESRRSSRPAAHRRAMSDSTVHDGDTGAFKIVISQPRDERRSKTDEDLNLDGKPLLNVSIPSWRLGTPRFTLRGTPLLRGSSYAGTEDVRSSNASFFRSSPLEMNSLHPESFAGPRPTSVTVSQFMMNPPNLLSPNSLIMPRFPVSHSTSRTTYRSTAMSVEPAMFDSLTFSPDCDDRSIVRYTPITGVVTAATPARLVAEITSPNFLDYELISDFFLTFRSFLDTPDLLRMLIARLQWAISRHDEIGMVVRVRTFVAIRHWILNYFVDDFVVDYHLRITFCNLINDLVEEVSRIEVPACRKVQLKILAEMKRCWRRVCALYWDGPEFDACLDAEIPIAPGGIAGHRDPSLDPSFWESDSDRPPHLMNVELPQRDSRPDLSFYADVSKAGHLDTILLGGERPATPEDHVDLAREQQASPTSTESIDVVSCSFPLKALRMGASRPNKPAGAHPVDPSSIYTGADPIAPTPRALTGKRVRAEPSHRRNGSLTDSLREHSKTTEKILHKNAELLMTFPYAGSLVRGNLLPPSQPFVDVGPPYGATAKRNTTIFQPLQPQEDKEKGSASAMSSQGMRKLIGSVRRAVSSRGQGSSVTQGNLLNITSIGTRGVTTNRLPGTAVVPQTKSRAEGVRHPVRIDLLGASASDDFKRAVQEDAAAEAEAEVEAKAEANHSSIKIGNEDLEYSAAHLDSSFDLQLASTERPTSDAAITAGSKSIVIVDGTAPTNRPAIPALLPTPSSPMPVEGLPASPMPTEAFMDSFMPAGNADPTPPNTPPGLAKPGGTPRRSSFILGHHHKESVPSDPLPPFIPDLATLGPRRPSEDTSFNANSPVDDVKPPNKPRPPPSYIMRHNRQPSSRSYRSKGSIIHRRWASFQSGFAVESTVKSFDATTTCSEGSIRSNTCKPSPLRVLRRMPGGDLKGAKNVADLDAVALHRTRSAGSLTTYSESIRSSYIRSPVRGSGGFVNVANSDYSQNHAEVLSLGAIAEQVPKERMSLFSTHSSKPALRASFEAEAQKLAQIPDDDDDGGVESALLKLEGRFQRKPLKLSMDLRQITPKALEEAAISPMSTVGSEQGRDDKQKHRNLHVAQDDVALVSPVSDTRAESHCKLQVPRGSEMDSFLSDASRESYDSTPLLERGLTDDGHSKRDTQEWADHSVLQGPDTPENEMDGSEASSSLHPSYEIVNHSQSMDNIQVGETIPRSRDIPSFLDVESDAETDLSSELSGSMIELDEFSPDPIPSPRQPLNHEVGTPRKNSTDARDIASAGSDQRRTITAKPAPRPSSADTPALKPREPRVWSRKPLLPAPDSTPTVEMYHNVLEGFTNSPSTSNGALRNAPQPQEDPQEKLTVHLPFVLAFDSEVLAQQFTLIEKDALNEVDWKELIDMRWKNANTDPRSWVDFLRNTDAHGVEVVIARFNVMVKWVVSEIVLTQDQEERARCVIKFLHIAAHCRRYRNFATMSQIAIALTSAEVARLSRTWAMIPPGDMRTMSDLESLVSPTKNFYNLRAEMEGGGNSPDIGCIPFVGIYTHDLLFNSQRPSEIASSPSTPPLVNFERWRIAASVVKTLLRLLEASTLYQFQPIEGITERCLWMTALSDDEIRKHSESLE